MSKKTPQIRFKGFTGDWEERKLGDVISISSEKNGNQFSRADVLSVSREAGVVNQIEYQGRSFAGASIANYRVVHKGDLIYTKSPLKGAPNGIFKTSEAEGIVSPLYAVYQSREANAAFVGWLLSNDNFATHYLYPLVNKGSKNTLLVSDADAISGHLSFPNIEEQAKIVSFFTQLDNLIALHQRKLDLLKEQKKGFLQKMFPKNGARVPELRFAGFADDWEERKLGNELTLLKDGTHGTHQNVLEGPLLLSAKNIKNGKIIIDEITDRKISVEEYNSIHKKFSLEKGDVLLTIVGSIGETAIIENPIGITFQRSVAYLRPSHTILSQFLFTTINGQKFQMELRKRQVVSAQPGIYLGDLSIIPILIPSVAEQEKIGSFFKQLDETIALHQRKLDLLKQQKKGFLQKMFVS